MKVTESKTRLLAVVLLALAAGLMGPAAFAGDSGSGSGSGPGPLGSGGSDDGDTTPLVGSPTSNHPPGFHFVGSMEDLSAVLLEVRGSGSVDVQRTDDGLVAVSLTGNFAIRVDRSALASRNVKMRYSGPEGSLRIQRNRDRLILVQRARGPRR